MKKVVKAAITTVSVISVVLVATYAAMVYALWSITPKLEPLEEDGEDYSIYDEDVL